VLAIDHCRDAAERSPSVIKMAANRMDEVFGTHKVDESIALTLTGELAKDRHDPNRAVFKWSRIRGY
jgi:hypothetical protein